MAWPVELWKSVFDWGSVVLVSLTVVAGAGALITGKIIGDRQDQKIAELNSRTSEAERKEAEARQHTAELEEAAAAARLETEKLKQAVAWRVISPEAASQLGRILSRNPGKVNLRYTDGDPEALFLALQYRRILEKAKWQVAPGALKLPNGIQFGIALPDANGADASTLRSAFSAAKMEYSPGPLPPGGMGFLISTIEGAPTLMIGSKLPPAW